MADDDFDLPALAAYLHMLPDQVTRLAQRGNLPGRRVGGQWRFSRLEISHWLEARIGAADDSELAAVETALRRADRAHVGDFVMEELLPLDAVAVPLPARTRNSVIADMCRLAASTGMLWDVPRMIEAVAARESLGSTALDVGAALLHPRRPQASILGQSILALGVVPQGIPFGGAAGRLTDVFFLIAAASDHEYLRILARLSRIVGDLDWLANLRAAPDSATARDLLLSRDAQLSD